MPEETADDHQPVGRRVEHRAGLHHDERSVQTALDLAQLVAFLEIRFGLDPFSAQTSLSAVRTVGDLCQTYRRCAGEA